MKRELETYRVMSKDPWGWLLRRKRFRSRAAAIDWARKNPIRGEKKFRVIPHTQANKIN